MSNFLHPSSGVSAASYDTINAKLSYSRTGESSEDAEKIARGSTSTSITEAHFVSPGFARLAPASFWPMAVHTYLIERTEVYEFYVSTRSWRPSFRTSAFTHGRRVVHTLVQGNSRGLMPCFWHVRTRDKKRAPNRERKIFSRHIPYYTPHTAAVYLLYIYSADIYFECPEAGRSKLSYTNNTTLTVHVSSDRRRDRKISVRANLPVATNEPRGIYNC